MATISISGVILKQKTFLHTPSPGKGRKVVYELLLCQNFDVSDCFTVCLVKILLAGQGNVVAARVFLNKKKAEEGFRKARLELLG